MASAVTFLLQSAVLVLIYTLCSLFVTWTHFPLPANVLGLIILFCLLCAGIVKEEHIQSAAGFFLKHLVFFFIAVAVELIDWGTTFYDYGLILFLALFVSTIIPYYSVGVMMQKFMKGKN
ncbi:MAG: CidA/LrgA family protein [Desulfovibrio sp.]|jgi:holin-like protein|nr:CidA/LrgA family protein [Desulfovibrio sp.]